MATGGGEQHLVDECFDLKSTICMRKNGAKQAQNFSIDCSQSLCSESFEIYNEHNEGHTLVAGHGNVSEVNLLTEKCETHKGEVIKLFCVGHDELACSICAVTDHSRCHEQLKHITNSFEVPNKNQTVHEVSGQLKTALQNVDQVITALEQHIEELSQREHKFLEEIEDYTKRLLAKIETLQQNARQAVSSKNKRPASEATEKRIAIATAKKDIIKCMDDMTSAGSRKAHLFILKKKGQSMAKHIETLCRDSKDMMKRVESIFELDLRLEDTLNDFNSLVTEREKYKVSMKMNIDASVKADSKSCAIEGCCLLPDGTVLLTDANNKRVKHVDPFCRSIKKHCDLKGGGLRGITCIRRHEVAVCTGSTSVQVVSLGNKIACTSTLQLNHKCYRAALSNMEWFITENNCVYVYDLTGTLLRTIFKNRFGEKMFSFTKGIVLNQTRDRVYVADFYKGLICTDREGRGVFRLSVKELGLSGAHGVCTDQRGNVLICGYESNNVVQITEDGRVIGEILSKADGIVKPHCLCYDADRQRLYVGGHTSHLLMYQLV